MQQNLKPSSKLDFMSGGGKMGALIRAYDWESTPLGKPENWPQPLKITVRILLSTGHPMFIWWGEELIQFYNDAFARSLGTERHPSALGQGGRECWEEIWQDIGWQIDQVLAGKGHTWHENQLIPITRNGTWEDVYWTYCYGPIDDPNADTGVGGVLVICTETTKQMQAEQRMKVAEARWRSLFDQAPSLMCILDGPEHYFEYANINFRSFLNQPDILGKKIVEVVPELEAQGFAKLLDEVFATGISHQGEAVPFKFEQGEVQYFDFIYQPIKDDQGQVTGILVEGYEVTDRVLANKSLREDDRRKDEFLAMLAHELRNPLAPIRNVSEMLTLSAQHDSKLKNISDILARQVSHMTHLLDDLLDVSRISQNRITLDLAALDVSHIIKVALESLQSAITAKNHQVTFTDSDTPIYVNGDNTRLVQCVTNIVNNAIKYTEHNGRIEIVLSEQGDTVTITVSDNGCGISQKMQSEVFSLFKQAPQTLDRSQGGLGIGLNIVQRLVTLHGGRVCVESKGLGHGSSFSITLPKIDAPQNKIVQPEERQHRQKRVLVVDDNVDAADSMSELLQILGHSVATAYTAHDALLNADSFDPDIILLDIGLPDMNGYEVAKEMLQKNRHRSLIALTGYGQPEDVLIAKQVGFKFHFTKPVNLRDLNDAISSIE
ncbi:PAS domain-containing hybrid sensor histidine kinase/response regulator [Aliiglaciecola litoralis]|uniref:histidine kinase n=1 Tax=Aliiglaciecola litoralis TaxID=582857 RepID=A0ABP3X2C8_9ALTE